MFLGLSLLPNISFAGIEGNYEYVQPPPPKAAETGGKIKIKNASVGLYEVEISAFVINGLDMSSYVKGVGKLVGEELHVTAQGILTSTGAPTEVSLVIYLRFNGKVMNKVNENSKKDEGIGDSLMYFMGFKEGQIAILENYSPGIYAVNDSENIVMGRQGPLSPIGIYEKVR